MGAIEVVQAAGPWVAFDPKSTTFSLIEMPMESI
jgi:hypothetical protein